MSPEMFSMFSPVTSSSCLSLSREARRGSLQLSWFGKSYTLYFLRMLPGVSFQGSRPNSIPRLRQFLPVTERTSLAAILLKILTSPLTFFSSLFRKPTYCIKKFSFSQSRNPWPVSVPQSSYEWTLAGPKSASRRCSSSCTPG